MDGCWLWITWTTFLWPPISFLISPGTHTLITTRNPGHVTIPPEGLEIPVLGVDASLELLLVRNQLDCTDESDRAHAAQIVRERGYLALAIEQVAAVIRKAGLERQISRKR